MRTERPKGYIVSELRPRANVCDFHEDGPAEDVRKIAYSSSGQDIDEIEFRICADCRLDLIHHLSARD